MTIHSATCSSQFLLLPFKPTENGSNFEVRQGALGVPISAFSNHEWLPHFLRSHSSIPEWTP